MTTAGPDHTADDSHWPYDHSLRLPSLPRRIDIVERIMSQAIRDPLVAGYRGRAQFTFFCGAEPGELAGYQSQLELVGRCLEWFVFDYIVPELETTPAQHWYDLYAEDLTAQERQDARDCLKFVLGLFEVQEVESEVGFLAGDLLRPPLQHHVREQLLTREIKAGQLLLGRLFPHRESFVLSGMSVVMSHGATEQIKQLIRQGRIKPAAMLEHIDGIELENCFESSFREVRHLSRDVLEKRLQCYIEQVCPDLVAWTQFQKMMAQAQDPLTMAAEFAEQMEICGRHEMDLIFNMVITLWQRYRGQ